jgi:hypothetical protein
MPRPVIWQWYSNQPQSGCRRTGTIRRITWMLLGQPTFMAEV